VRKKKNETHSSKLNLLECRPVRQVQYELAPSGIIVLLRPRFTSGLLARWLQPRLKRPYVKITLDRIGSFVWTRCDGDKTVEEILEEMKASFGEERAMDPNGKKKGHDPDRDMEHAPERLRLFLLHLKQNEMITFER